MIDKMHNEIRFDSPKKGFFGSNRTAVGDVKYGDVAFIGMPSDATHTSRIGTRFGPRAMRHETSNLINELRKEAEYGLVDTETGNSYVLGDARKILDLGDASIDALNVANTVDAISKMTQSVVEHGALPVAIGGDHFNSFPACLGVSKAISIRDPSQRIGYIQIDGHLDFGDKLAAWGSFNHATNARRCSELPNISRENMVWIGIAGWVDGNDVAEIEGFGGLIISAEELHRLGAKNAAKRALEHAMKKCDHIYLTIDVDALDSGFLPGTGSIVHSEINCRQYLELLEIFGDVPLCGVDMVEVSPPLDPSGRSEVIAAQLLFEVLRKHFIHPLELRK
jgi:arginase family enzyme